MSSTTYVDVIVRFSAKPTKTMLDKVRAKGGTVKKQFVNVPAVLYNLSGAALADIGPNTDVVYASKNRPLKGTHDYANPALNAPLAFSSGRVGTNIGIAVRRLGAAEGVPPPEGSGSAWVNGAKVLFGLVSRLYSGEIALVKERLPNAIADAKGRGDLQAETALVCRCAGYILLAGDDPEGMRVQVRAAIARWSHRNYYLHHFWALLAEADAALYSGEAGPAWERVRTEWPAMEKAHTFEMQIITIEALHMRARLALALAAAASGRASRKALLDRASADIRKIESERTEWGAALAMLLRAGVARLEESPGAGAMAERAEASLAACGMKVHAAARRCAGLWNGEAEVVAKADAVMLRQGIRHPTRYAAMLAPPG